MPLTSYFFFKWDGKSKKTHFFSPDEKTPEKKSHSKRKTKFSRFPSHLRENRRLAAYY